MSMPSEVETCSQCKRPIQSASDPLLSDAGCTGEHTAMCHGMSRAEIEDVWRPIYGSDSAVRCANTVDHAATERMLAVLRLAASRLECLHRISEIVTHAFEHFERYESAHALATAIQDVLEESYDIETIRVNEPRVSLGEVMSVREVGAEFIAKHHELLSKLGDE